MKAHDLFAALGSRIRTLVRAPNRNLLIELVRADFTAYDHNSLLNISWSLVNPIITFLVMYLIFDVYFGKSVTAYPLYLLVGVIMINFFVTATTYMSKLFFFSRDIILNTTIPREYYILSNFSIHAYKLLIELAIAWAVSVLSGFFNWTAFLLFLPLLAAYLCAVVGVGFVLASLYCFARDVEHVWMLAARLLFFVTPVFYTLEGLRPPVAKAVYWLNPLTPFLVAGRQLIIPAGGFSRGAYLHGLIAGAAIFIGGYAVFLLLEKKAIEKI